MARQQHRHQSYDHRLRDLVRKTGDLTVATAVGVPRSTAFGWLRGDGHNVITLDVVRPEEDELRAEIVKLRRRIRILGAVVGLLLAFLLVSGFKLEGRLPEGRARSVLLRAIERARKILPLRSVLRILGVSRFRFQGWFSPEDDCHPPELSSCPRRAVNQMTSKEASVIHDMAIAPEYRHVSTSRLAILAQRLGRVFASPSTWRALIRENGWRRPRQRIHPNKPKVGLRTTRPNEAWHVDTTVIRLLNGTKAYIHAVIDNYSRRILAFCVAERFEIANAVAILAEAAKQAVSTKDGAADDTPMLVVDGGVENFNGGVDALVQDGVLRRVLAQTEIKFSNSLIEAFWKVAKHQWLFLNTLDTVAAVKRLFSFYVTAHNTEIPHSAFRGQTPDEMYFGKGDDVPGQLAAAMKEAQAARLKANREANCEACSGRPRHRGPRHDAAEALAAA